MSMSKSNYRKIVDMLEARQWTTGTVEEAQRLIRKEYSDYDFWRERHRESYDGSLIHSAMLYGAPAEVVQVLLEFLPKNKTLKRVTKKGKQTPLHCGMDGGDQTPTLSLRLVLDAYPEAANIKDAGGRLPLHIGMEKRAPLASIRAVLEAYPEAAKVQDSNLKTPLHSGASLHSGTYSGIQQLNTTAIGEVWGHGAMKIVADQYPPAVNTKDRWEATPLENLLKNNAPTKVVMSLLSAYPSVLDAKDAQGRTTLVAAVMMGVKRFTLIAIIEKYPYTARQQFLEDGRNFLHLIMERKEASLALPAVLKAHEGFSPESYMTCDARGQTPLHIGMKSNVLPGAIDLLLNAFPNGAKLQDSLGQTPLAIGVSCGAPLDCILHLLAVFPGAALLANSQGETPLHTCISSSNPDCDVVKALLKHCRECSTVPNRDGLPPLHLAIQTEAPLAIFNSILEVVPDAALTKDANGDTPLHLSIKKRTFSRKAVSSKKSVKGRWSMAALLIVGLLQTCPAVAKAVDGEGNTPLLCLLFEVHGRHAKGTAARPPPEVAVIWKELCDMFPFAGEMENDAGVSPCGLLVSHCPVSARDHFHPAEFGMQLKEFHQLALLKMLMNGLRDGRPLKKICKLRDPATLTVFLSLFSVDTSQAYAAERHLPGIDLNGETIHRWTFLEILADMDSDDSDNILLEIVEAQHEKLHKSGSHISITCCNDARTSVDFVSVGKVSDKTMRKVADRAKLSIRSDKLREWGEAYGRFLRKYRIDKYKEPKHISETCVVVFATESRLDDEGRRHDVRVALKFLNSPDAFFREIHTRQIIREAQQREEGPSSSPVVSIIACYTSLSEEEIGGKDDERLDAVQLEFGVYFDELETYENIRLNSGGQDGSSKELSYLLVLECGSEVDLNDIIIHQNIAGRDLPMVLAISTRIAECLEFLNEECLVAHGDVKARNFVSLGVGAGYAAIDLDNASSIEGQDVMGQKRTSTGYMPPEQAAVEASHRRREAADAGLDLKMMRSELEDLKTKMKSAFDYGRYDEQILLLQAHQEAQSRLKELESNSGSAPEVTATSQYDMWCFGVLLYYLCTGVQLFNMDFREDVNDMDLLAIQTWTKEGLLRKLKNVPEGFPRTLLADLLQPRPINRPSTWSHVLESLRAVQAGTATLRLAPADDPCMWSITYWQLMELDKTASHEFGVSYSQVTMRDIAERIITPRCRTTGTSFALSLNAGGLMLDAFVSHSWDEPFGDFVTSIRKVFQTSVKKPNLWICAFALNQYDHSVVESQLGSDEATPLTNSPFVRALKHALSFVVVRNSTTDLYERIWCVCELIYAKKLGLVPNKTYVTGPDMFSKRRTSCVDAQSTNPEDKKRILHVLLEDKNVGEIDEMVQLFRGQEAPE